MTPGCQEASTTLLSVPTTGAWQRIIDMLYYDHRAAPIVTGAMIARAQAKARKERAKAFAELCKAIATPLKSAVATVFKASLIGKRTRA